MAPKKKTKAEAAPPLPAVLWQWCDGDSTTGNWRAFTDADQAIIEKQFQAKNNTFSTGEMSFSIGSVTDFDLVKGIQVNQSTKKVRQIRRLTNGAVWEYVDDHGMYVAFYDDDNLLIETIWRTMPPDGGKFVTKALSWNKGYDSSYLFVFSKNDAGDVVATQKNEDSGNVRTLRRTLPGKVTWDTKGYGISGMAAPAVAAADAAPAATTTAHTPTGSAAAGGGAAAAASSAPAAAEASVAPSAISLNIFAPPATWQTQTLPFEMFTVPEGTKEYNDIIDPFLKTLHNKATIHSVQRLQNQPLWKFYALTRHKVALRNGGDPNEKLLYHGARVRENMNAIMEFGFDMRVARDGSAGVGIYFAVNSSYSNGGYVLQNPDKSKEMFVCRVTVGSSVQGKHGMKRPPPKPGKKDELYDSVHNGMGIMFIVFDNCQAYPEYLIKYTNLTGW